jgi:hypothetical protein
VNCVLGAMKVPPYGGKKWFRRSVRFNCEVLRRGDPWYSHRCCGVRHPEGACCAGRLRAEASCRSYEALPLVAALSGVRHPEGACCAGRHRAMAWNEVQLRGVASSVVRRPGEACCVALRRVVALSGARHRAMAWNEVQLRGVASSVVRRPGEACCFRAS